MSLTDEEKRLGECITTSDWRAIYQPSRHSNGDISGAGRIPPAGAIRPVPRASTEACEVACEDLEGAR
jgi:hypothetical protein